MSNDDTVRTPQRALVHGTTAEADGFLGQHGQTTQVRAATVARKGSPHEHVITIQTRAHVLGKAGGFVTSCNDARMPPLHNARVFSFQAEVPHFEGEPLAILHNYGYAPLVQVLDEEGFDRAQGLRVIHVNDYEVHLSHEGLEGKALVQLR